MSLHSWLGWAGSAPAAFTVQTDQAEAIASEVVRQERKLVDVLGPRFMAGLVASLLTGTVTTVGWGIAWGVYANRLANAEADIAVKADARTLDLIQQSLNNTDLDHTARLRSLEAGREENRRSIDELKAELAAVKARQEIVLKRLGLEVSK